MTAKIVALSGGKREDGTFDNALLTFFEAGAREVKEGVIVGVAAVLVMNDGGIATGFQGNCPVYATLGAIGVLHREFMDKKVQRDPDTEDENHGA